jgi:BirA family biotin operon repressor/biotin-[acetyl-CoA-carboxylase] ligase
VRANGFSSSFSPSLETQKWCHKAQVKCSFSPEVTSTNDWAKTEAFTEPNLVRLYLTQHQTAGRGRGTNTWMDQGQDQAFLSSWSIPLGAGPSPVLSPLIGLAVFRALSNTWLFPEWGLKPPNDIWVKNKKIAGLLIEVVQQGPQTQLIIGLGLNLLGIAPLITGTTLQQALGAVPLQLNDWLAFLDRLWMEFALTLTQTENGLSLNQSENLKYAINCSKSLDHPVEQVLPTGDLIQQGGHRISWQEL